MSMTVIGIAQLGKMYKLYRRPVDKVLDAFGLNRFLFWRKDYYQEFWALRGLSLQVRQGERLGIIGRNGAGKSTLLKVITGNIAPTEGTVQVTGRIQALLELGTGFHPEFSGRENIRASLAYQGLASAVVRDKEEEIIEFSELDDFIDQPVKTYSAGMYARLAFSTATAIEPEILIIDEVLGAGDAYFAAKCVERMRSLTEKFGATVLFVSHDLGSVQQLCERVIWIDRGRVVMDGSPLDATKAYYASILAQEELRIRARNARLARRQATQMQAREQAEDVKELLFRFVTSTGEPPREHHPIKRLTLLNANGALANVSPGSPMDNDASDTAYLLADPKYMLWREPESVHGDWIRCFAATGGKYGHAPFVMSVAREVWDRGGLRLEIEHAAVPGEVVNIEVFDGRAYQTLGALRPDLGSWRRESWSLPDLASTPVRAASRPSDVPRTAPATPESEPAVTQTAAKSNRDLVSVDTVHQHQPDDLTASNRSWDGVGQVTIRQSTADHFYSDYAEFVNVEVLDGRDHPRVVFRPGETLRLRVEVEVRIPIPVCEFSLALYTMQNLVVCVSSWPIPGGLGLGRHEWTVAIEHPNLRQDEYLISCALIREFSELTNENLVYYSLWNRSLSFRINEGRVGHTPLGLVSLQMDPPTGQRLSVRALVSEGPHIPQT